MESSVSGLLVLIASVVSITLVLPMWVKFFVGPKIERMISERFDAVEKSLQPYVRQAVQLEIMLLEHIRSDKHG